MQRFGQEIGIDTGAMIGAVLLVQFIGIPFTFLFGPIAAKIGTKRALYTVVSVIGYGMNRVRDFFVRAVLVGLVQGACQALSRSLYASLVPTHKLGKFFGFSVLLGISGQVLTED